MPIISLEYLLVKPYTIVAHEQRIEDFSPPSILVEPVLAGICGSDLAYFQGKKDPKKLLKRLPVPLLHEGVVRKVGTSDLYVAFPLQACGSCEACFRDETNLCWDAKFMGSTAPGLARDPFFYPLQLLLPLPSTIPPEVATITEPLSIAYHFLHSLDTQGKTIVLMGNGPLAFFIALMLSFERNMRPESLWVMGINEQKLASFQGLSRTILLTTLEGQRQFDALKGKVDIAIEAVGGDAMKITFNQLIVLVKNGGSIFLLGLSDKPVPSSLIDVVNKGLLVQGISRATLSDATTTLRLLEKRDMQQYIFRILDPKVFLVGQSKDLINALHYASAGRHRGKVLVRFHEH